MFPLPLDSTFVETKFHLSSLETIWNVTFYLVSYHIVSLSQKPVETEDLAWSCLLMAELADRPSAFPAWWVAKVAPEYSKYTKYTPSRAGPILEKPVLTQLYWEYIFLYCPSRRLWCGSFENSLGNTLCLEGYIVTVVFPYSIGG